MNNKTVSTRLGARVTNSMTRSVLRAGLVLLVMTFTAASLVSAQSKGQRITPNFRDVEIGQVIEAVAQVTGKTIIPDGRVRAQVTMLSQTAMTPDAFYEAFLALLQVYQFVAVESGGIIKIVPDANARQMPNRDLPSRLVDGSDELVTQVIAVENVNAAQLVPVLRPLMPQAAHLAAYPPSNILIVSDRSSNVSRVMRIIKRIDQQGDNEVDIVNLQHASSSEVVRVVNTFFAQQAAAEGGGGGSPTRIIADDRSNSVLIGGDKSARLRIKALIAHLDTPLESGGDTRVVYLQHADAEKIATKLKEQISATVAITGGAPPAGGAAPGGGGGGVATSADRTTTIWAEPETNALVITAPAKVMRSLMAIIDKLDIRRGQVLVEAIIVDVQVTKDAELGVNWAVWSDDDDTRFPLGTFQSPVGGVNLAQLAQAVDDPSSAPAELGTGTTFGIGRIAATGVNFAAMIRALQGDSNTNLISTPSAVTMDNQEAQLKVAQEVPFITGQFSSTGSGNDGSVNPFTTVQRQEVGTILKITPQINEGGATVQLKINIESSALSGTTGDADSAITNKRTIDTNVLIEDGGIIVLGGLIQDGDRRGEQRVPYLGRIPVLGALFKTRSRSNEKRNLMVFIRPKILRDGLAAAIETDAKYNYMRHEQEKTGRPKTEILPLIPFTPEPRLPPLPPPLPPRSGSPGQEPAPAPSPSDKPPSGPAEAPPPPSQPPPSQPPP
jgi:general secretion pathway protein D